MTDRPVVPEPATGPALGAGFRPSIPFLLSVALGVLLSVAGMLAVRELQDSRSRADLEDLAEERVALVASRLQSSLQRLEALHAFWISSDEVRWDEFQTFTGHLIAGEAGVQALSWAPRVQSAQLEEFEARASRFVPSFRIREPSPAGDMVPVAPRPEYFPVYYLRPLPENIAALGFDLYSERLRRETLQRACDLGQPVTSRPVRLFLAQGRPIGVLCVWPVYDPDLPQETEAERRVALQGYLVGAYRMRELVDHALATFSPPYPRIRVAVGPTEDELETVVDSAPDRLGGDLIEAETGIVALGSHWRIACVGDEAVIWRRRGPWPWLALAVGLLLAASVALALRQKQLRAEALARVNDQLLREARLMESLVQTQKLESLGVLAGGIAHDFNNLLTGILGNADLALRQLQDDHGVRPLLSQVRRAAERAADLTSQLLAYAGRATLERAAIDVSAVVRDITELMHTAIPPGVDLSLDLQDGLPAVEADRAQIQQMVLNLVLNGAEACRDGGGLVLVATRLVEPQAGEKGRWVRLLVEDTGSGMTPEVQRRMFEPFFTTKFAGRGLGLAAVVGIVKMHGGSIQVDTEPGAGTRMQVDLPASTRPVAVPRKEEAVGTDGHASILVVDDEELVRTVAERMLGDLGYRVWSAATADEALEIVRRERDRIDLVLLDLTMPGMTGPELLAAMRKVEPGMRAVFSSGYHESELGSVVQESGVAGFLQKPYTRDALARRMREALHDRRRPGAVPARGPAAGGDAPRG